MDAIQNLPDFTPIADLDTPPARAKVIAALAKGHSVANVARDTGVDFGKIYRWLRTEPEFKDAVKTAQREYVGSLNDGLRQMSGLAIEALRSVLEDPAAPAPTRLTAALMVLQRPMTPFSRRRFLDLIESSEKQQVFDKAA